MLNLLTNHAANVCMYIYGGAFVLGIVVSILSAMLWLRSHYITIKIMVPWRMVFKPTFKTA